MISIDLGEGHGMGFCLHRCIDGGNSEVDFSEVGYDLLNAKDSMVDSRTVKVKLQSVASLGSSLDFI